MRASHRLVFAALVVANEALDAQTYIVDAANGTGTNFTDLAVATATVPDGAVLDVRPGSYGSFAILGKGLSVVFQPGAVVQNGPLPWTSSIANTSAAQTVVLRHVVLGSTTGAEASIQITSCQGPVWIEDSRVAARQGPALVVGNAVQVHAARSSFGDATVTLTGARLDQSSVVFRNCSVAGAFPAIASTACQLQFVDSSIGGFPIYTILGPAIQMQGGDVRMIGGSTLTLFRAAVGGTGTARFDPSVVFSGGPPAEPTIQATFLAMPAVVATDGPLGGSVTVTLRGPAGDFGALFAGVPGPPLLLPGIADPSWLLPGTEVVCLASSLGTVTGIPVTYPIPNVPAVRGARLAWQGASFGPTNGLQASNPAVTTHW